MFEHPLVELAPPPRGNPGSITATHCYIGWYNVISEFEMYDDLLQWSSGYQRQIQDFPEEGAPTPGGAPTYDFAKFSQKLHEIERIRTPGEGAHPLRPP